MVDAQITHRGIKMTLQDYTEGISRIKKQKERELLILAEKFAQERNTIKRGDTITDHIGSICVEKIVLYNDRVPSCIYVGCCLTKKGKPFKSGEKRGIYQTNLIDGKGV